MNARTLLKLTGLALAAAMALAACRANNTASSSPPDFATNTAAASSADSASRAGPPNPTATPPAQTPATDPMASLPGPHEHDQKGTPVQ
jgi:hypothetical protein